MTQTKLLVLAADFPSHHMGEKKSGCCGGAAERSEEIMWQHFGNIQRWELSMEIRLRSHRTCFFQPTHKAYFALLKNTERTERKEPDFIPFAVLAISLQLTPSATCRG